MLLNIWDSISFICGAHDNTDNALIPKNTETKNSRYVSYYCSCTECKNRLSIDDVKKAVETISDYSFSSDGEDVCLTGMKWKTRGIAFIIINHDIHADKIVVSAKNTKNA